MVNKQTGLIAYMFDPVDELGKVCIEKDPIILFRGTAMSLDKQAKQEGHGKGIKADLDQKGIGYSQYEQNKESLQAWATQELAKNPQRHIAVVGHSLGGALAMRFMCDSKNQEKLHLTTFQSPGIDKKSAKGFKAQSSKNVLHQIVTGDMVTAAGETRLPGHSLILKGGANPKNNHLEPVGTKACLNGLKKRRYYRKLNASKGSLIIEGTRKSKAFNKMLMAFGLVKS